MGKPRLFAIKLTGRNSVYFAGSNVEGNVSLDLSEPEKTQGISIMFSGKAYVHWTEHSERSPSHYRDTQTIFRDVFKQLWGDGNNSQEMAAGSQIRISV